LWFRRRDRARLLSIDVQHFGETQGLFERGLE